MTTKERKLVTEAWTETIKKTNQTLMVQVGGSSLTDVKDMVCKNNYLNAPTQVQQKLINVP